MYRRSKFLELLLEIRQDMALEADHDIDQFVQNLRVDAGSQEDKPSADAAGPADVRLNGSEIRRAAMRGRKP